jgi:hypothetical protein
VKGVSNAETQVRGTLIKSSSPPSVRYISPIAQVSMYRSQDTVVGSRWVELSSVLGPSAVLRGTIDEQ